MNHNLYFVPILAQALEDPDRGASLRKAFETIERRGQEPGYQEGYRNFCRFMAEVRMHRRMRDEHDLRMVALELVTDSPSDVRQSEALLSQLLERGPWLKDEYEALARTCEARPKAFTLQLLVDGQSIAELTFKTAVDRRAVNGIRPGRYVLRLDTGLVLWEGTLTAADLIWTAAFEGQNLALAAEAGEVRHRPSRELRIPNAGLTLRIFPGVERGSLEIERTA